MQQQWSCVLFGSHWLGWKVSFLKLLDRSDRDRNFLLTIVEWRELVEKREKGKTVLGESYKCSEFRQRWGACPHEGSLRMANAGMCYWDDLRWWVQTKMEGKWEDRIAGSCHSLPSSDCYFDESVKDCIEHARRNSRGRKWCTERSLGSGPNCHGDWHCLHTSAVRFAPQSTTGPEVGWQKRFRKIMCPCQ